MAPSSLIHTTDIVMGQSPPGETCNTSSIGLPLLNGPTEFGPHHPTPVQFTTDARKRAQPGDVLFCARGSTTGRMNWADREYAIGRGVAAIRHKINPKLQPFVHAVVEYGLPGLLAHATGSTFPNVSSDQLAGLWWPPLSEGEQHAIAHILGTLDNKIELNRVINGTLDVIVRALFKSWFIDFDPVRAKAEGRVPSLPKPIADLFPDSFEDSELGEIPNGWSVERLSDVMTFQGGSQPPADKFISEPREGYVRLVQIRDFYLNNHMTFVPATPKASCYIFVSRLLSTSGRQTLGKTSIKFSQPTNHPERAKMNSMYTSTVGYSTSSSRHFA